LRSSLAMATATLLGGGSSATAATPIQTDANVLYYSEAERVEAVEAEVSISRELREDENVTLIFLFDSLTGPSPNGATPASRAQTFTTPSGRGSYVIGPGDHALDPTFHDTRFAGTAQYGRKWGRLTDLKFGARVSSEHDYLSISGTAGLSRDLNERNTTLSLGLSFAADEWRPEGGVPTPGGEMPPPNSALPREGSADSKSVLDAVFGATQVFGRNTIGRVNYTLSSSTGYLTDPYKLLSVLHADGTLEAGDPIRYLYESRPDSRVRHSVFAQIKHYLRGSVLDASYRFHLDDWGVLSHTGDFRFRQPVGGPYFLQPHIRYYHQREADFFTRFLVDGQALPDYATADPRLAGFDALTLGLKAGRRMPNGNELSLTLEWYQQFSMRGPPDTFGTLNDLDLWSEADAIMLRVGYGHDWFF